MVENLRRVVWWMEWNVSICKSQCLFRYRVVCIWQQAL